MPDLIGSSIDGWRVVSQIGEGSMGTVWDARKGKQRAALKLMRPDSAAEDSLPRFRREAKLLTRIKNPHVMRCFGLGERDDGFLYLLLEYIDGGSLEDLLERRGRLTIPQTVCAIRGVLTASLSPCEWAHRQSMRTTRISCAATGRREKRRPRIRSSGRRPRATGPKWRPAPNRTGPDTGRSNTTGPPPRRSDCTPETSCAYRAVSKRSHCA